MKQRRDEMDVIDERALVYMAVLFVRSAVAVFAGPARAAATFGFVTASVEGAYWLGRSLAGRYMSSNQPVSGIEGNSAMRVDSRAMERDVCVARARMFGAMVAGALLMAGCDMMTVVSEEGPTDYAVCIEKREAGDMTPDLAALDCVELAEQAGTEIV